MARPGRVRGQRGSGGGAVVPFAVACLVVLALTFLLGVLVGRQWARRTAGAPPRIAASAGEGPAASPGTRSRVRRLGERYDEDPGSQIQGKLTFYQTLTAPLTSGPPPPPRSPAAASPRASSPAPKPESSAAESGVLYTVQVAAFKTRGPADKLRDTLGADAYVAEMGSGAPYRVRVGSFATRAEAEARVAQVRAEHPLNAFVTRR